MFSFLIILFMLATCFDGAFETVSLDTWVIVFAISVLTDVQIFKWIFSKK